MNNNEKNITNGVLSHSLEWEKELAFRNSEVAIQYSLAHLDFLKNLSAINIAILGAGYLVDKISFNIFSVAAFLFASIDLIIIISYAREKIDDEIKRITETLNDIIKVNRQIQSKCRDILSGEKEFTSLKEYVDTNCSNKDNNGENQKDSYIGEIVVLFFYIAFFSSVAYLVDTKMNMGVMQDLICCFFILILSWFLSFRNWSKKFIGVLSINM
jgi:hypothetical protein